MARVAIDAMKKELTELQPKLKETAIVVENLMVKILFLKKQRKAT
jgi:hypothetical protein